MQDHAVRHLRHRLRLHLHAGADGGGQVSQLWDVAFCYSFSLGDLERTVNINHVQIPGGGVPGVLPHHEDGGQREVPDPGHLAPHPPLQHPALAHTQHPSSGQQ